MWLDLRVKYDWPGTGEDLFGENPANENRCNQSKRRVTAVFII
jgi:hypothetical protein